ncbi:conserved hypothetical protein [gamma proteobacterium NOR5-3]|nr:conserved hypothetical protein [gamma proteobacterium NOR5-3]
MDGAVVSEELSSHLANSTVKAAVFTTYTFDPEFFELEVIPLLLSGNRAFSSDSRVKQFQVREALRESQIPLDVFYDLPMYRREGSCSPAMEYAFHGIHRGNNAFHSKLALILVEDHDEEGECLMVAAGSNNLTRAGWWSNIECVHWEFVYSGACSLRFLNQLKRDVAWLQEQRRIAPQRSDPALDKIARFLEECKSTRDAADVSYYGLTSVDGAGAFQGFLIREAGNRMSYSNYNLEIISPFFASDVNNTEHEYFFKLGVVSIQMLLPEDSEGNALCDEAYFEHINNEPDIQWARWSDDSDTLLGRRSQVFRPLHAKIYHFYNAKQSWAFVGSVNFTHKAMRENIEAGFFVKLNGAGPLLKPIRRPSSVEKFAPIEEAFPGLLAEEETQTPQIDLAYDWTEQVLTGVTDPHLSYTITIFTPEGRAAVADWAITGTERVWEGDVTALEGLLRNGSLVKVGGYNTRSGEAFPPQTVMLMQTGWTHKPLGLPELSAAEILAIYARLTPEQREQIIIAPIIRQLVLAGEAGDLTLPLDEHLPEQFFSEYAEIFNAFRHLRKRLSQALEDDNQVTLNYYLSGKGMDSLPTLIEHVTSEESSEAAVTAYLVLLCAQEVYKDKTFRGMPRVNTLEKSVRKQIVYLKSSGAIRLENDSPARRKAFFKWFESQFYHTYRTKEALE